MKPESAEILKGRKAGVVYTKSRSDLSSMAKSRKNFRFDEELIKQVEKLAKKENRSLTNFIETLMLKAVETSKKNKSKPD